MTVSMANQPALNSETALRASTAQETPFPALPRLTPEIVLSAARATGLRLVRNSFGSRGQATGCALTALYAAATEGGWLDDERGPTLAACERLGLDVDYLTGFVGGWDGYAGPQWQSDALCDWERIREGYEDGVAAAKALLGDGFAILRGAD